MPASQVMHKWKHGQLHSGSKSGPVVKSRRQAIAIMLSEKRKEGQHGGQYPEKKASGGINMENMVLRGASYGLRHEGMLNSSVPGRTDRLPMSVKSGSYVLPADIPSALGQGNSIAGGKILSKMFTSGPYGMAPMRGGHGSGQPKMRMMTPPRPPKGLYGANGGGYGVGAANRPAARGGTKGERADSHVPIVAAGGEFLIHPDVVRDIGHGSVEAGHKVLDKFVLNIRKKYAETLKRLPGPKK